QVTRLLSHPKRHRFVNSFADQWLNLREIDFTSPDSRRFRTFDAIVQHSMLEETRGFLDEMIKGNLPVTHVIHSEMSVLNERLARFYGFQDLPIVPGRGMQRVSLPPGAFRGGLVTQGAVLKVTADGTSTSPIVRGAFIGERILGFEIPPPPPNIPAVEPDIRGAVSIRDQLDKHRNDTSCASCHQKIDPPGFALENYDPVGLWRTKYGKARIDPSGRTLEGQSFADVREWKDIYRKQPDLLTRNLVRQLLTYGTGAPLRFSDRPEIEEMVRSLKKKNYGMRSIIHSVAGSQTFRRK
ncbi:MAG: DUF1588 domain-containing protein, partial [Verrucomicrobiota bacterium]